MKDNEALQLDHKNVKSQLNSAKLDQTKLEAEFSKLKEQYQQLDITSTKLTNQCEVRHKVIPSVVFMVLIVVVFYRHTQLSYICSAPWYVIILCVTS